MLSYVANNFPKNCVNVQTVMDSKEKIKNQDITEESKGDLAKDVASKI